MQEGQIAVIGQDGELFCPKCGDMNIHQDRVIVESREEEDGPAKQTVCDGKNVQTKENVTTASGRRDNLIVEFWCEGCSFVADKNGKVDMIKFSLLIQQHKGATYLSWIN